jgi:nucleoside phosphorylase
MRTHRAQSTNSAKGARKGKPAPKLDSALKVPDLPGFFRKLPSDLLPQVTHVVRRHLAWAIGDPTEAKIRAIHEDCALLGELIDFEVVVQRLKLLNKFERSSFGVSLSRFFPELDIVFKAAAQAIFDLPKSVRKAEDWLEPIAREAGADADIEATIYFAGQGRTDLVDPSALRELWHRDICYTITRGGSGGRIPKDAFARAKDCTISLSEAADILESSPFGMPRFFSFRDEEEEFIDAAFFRAVEWLNVTGFDRWLKSFIAELSTGPQNGIDHGRAGWSLFHWCRSTLALRMAERNGLEAWLWALINGPHDRSKPWQVFFSPPGQPVSYRNYVPLAGIIPFVWHRIQPNQMKDDVVVEANKLLFECQTHAGGWPTYTDESKPCLLATCTAIHGLALSRPPGWHQAVSKAADWVMAQQEPGGHWTVSGGPAVMLSVLALDSISLGKGSDKQTLCLNALSSSNRHIWRDGPFDYSQAPWYRAALPKTKPVSLKTAQRRFHPALGIVVATQVELKAALKRFRPSASLTCVWQVSHSNDTFYLGRFGAFEAVLMLCSMGTQGASGSTLASEALIRLWSPTVVVMAGIAFGSDRSKHRPGDVLVAQHIIPYEAQRLGAEVQFRNPVPPASGALLNRFRNILKWRFKRPDGAECKVHYGAMLSGEKLIDDKSFKQSLLEQYPAAIGGEMEGAGLWASADRNRKEWLVVKGVCDWADGEKNDNYQALAAAASISLCEEVFQNRHALAGL